VRLTTGTDIGSIVWFDRGLAAEKERRMAKPPDIGSPPLPTYTNPDMTPFIYFDIAPTYGVMAGAIQIELAARTLVPVPATGGVRVNFTTTAHLRCGPAAAALLRDAINEALKLYEQELPNTGAAAASRLN
jgi:hypothetical protein